MEVDEAPRAGGCFKLDRAVQEHMDDSRAGIMDDSRAGSFPAQSRGKPSEAFHGNLATGFDAQFNSSIQTVTGTSRLRELQERLQSRARENSEREERPPTWRENSVRSGASQVT